MVVAEDGGSEAARLRPIFADLAAPDLIPVEVANAAWKKVRQGEVAATVGAALLAALRASGMRPLPFGGLPDDAAELARELDHPIYDCLYVAAMAPDGRRLVAADRRLHAKLAAGRFAPRAYLLDDVDRLIADVGGGGAV